MISTHHWIWEELTMSLCWPVRGLRFECRNFNSPCFEAQYGGVSESSVVSSSCSHLNAAFHHMLQLIDSRYAIIFCSLCLVSAAEIILVFTYTVRVHSATITPSSSITKEVVTSFYYRPCTDTREWMNEWINQTTRYVRWMINPKASNASRKQARNSQAYYSNYRTTNYSTTGTGVSYRISSGTFFVTPTTYLPLERYQPVQEGGCLGRFFVTSCCWAQLMNIQHV